MEKGSVLEMRYTSSGMPSKVHLLRLLTSVGCAAMELSDAVESGSGGIVASPDVEDILPQACTDVVAVNHRVTVGPEPYMVA